MVDSIRLPRAELRWPNLISYRLFSYDDLRRLLSVFLRPEKKTEEDKRTHCDENQPAMYGLHMANLRTGLADQPYLYVGAFEWR